MSIRKRLEELQITLTPPAPPAGAFVPFVRSGSHARSAFGVAQIPFGACVEIELIAEVE